MLHINKIFAIALVATFIAAIPLTVLSSQSELEKAVYTITIEDYFAKPSDPPGKDKTSSDYKIMLRGYVTNTPVTLTVYTNNGEGISTGYFMQVMRDAAETWDAATSAELAVNPIEKSSGSGIVAGDYVNSVYFANLDTDVIAQASVWYIRLTREIVDCDIEFNTDFAWGDANVEPEKMDLQNIATHELGHFFNLADIYDSTKAYLTMYGYSDEGDVEKRTLEPGDIAGIQKVFGP